MRFGHLGKERWIGEKEAVTYVRMNFYLESVRSVAGLWLCHF